MRVAIARESRAHERRVAMVPELVSRLTAMDLDVVVELGAGSGSFHTDDAYRDAGATVIPTPGTESATPGADPLGDADVVLSVNALPAERMRGLREGAITLSFLSPGESSDVIDAARDARVTAFSIELVPRISRAQSMDGLTSQAMAGGYRAVLVAAERLPRFFPLNMTAAGTVPPAQVLVLGAGVAGLQAIATARRLGAKVSAYDVRSASADEVRILGAAFVELDLPTLEGSGGYAREMSEERAQMQRDLLAEHVAESDVLITTAAVPGRQAPLLVERSAVERMKPGSVVVDLAAESGGNVEGSLPGEEIMVGSATLWGGQNVPSQLAVHASRLYAGNLVALLTLLTGEGGQLAPDFDDEIVAAACVTHAGEIRVEVTS